MSNTAYQGIVNFKIMTASEDDCINIFVWLVDKTLHHEAFMQQTAHLKELKYKMQRIKVSHVHNKMHFSNVNKGQNKMR